MEVTPSPRRQQFKPRASSTPFLAGRCANEPRRSHSALHLAFRSARRPHRAERIVWAGAQGVWTRACRPSRQHHSPPPWQVSSGRAGTWLPDGCTRRDHGRRPAARGSRGPEAGGRGARDGALGPRARGYGQGQRRARLSPPEDGGRRDPGSKGGGGAAGSHPAGGAARAGQAARAAARPRKGYLLHGSLDGGVWRLGLFQQLQDLLKPLLVRFPLILHFGLLQIKPDTGRDGANVTPHAQARGLPAPSNAFLPARPAPAPPKRLGPFWTPWRKSRTTKPGELILAAQPPMSAAPAAAAAARKEPTRLSHREFAIWPLDPLTGAPWVLMPRSFLQPNPTRVLFRLLLI